jgi:hypothetical protein
MSRYDKSKSIINNSRVYQDIFDEKDLKSIFQKPTFSFQDLQNIGFKDPITYIWNKTDKIYNISNRFYGTSDLYWVILYSNRYTSPFQIKEGDILYIYLTLPTSIR